MQACQGALFSHASVMVLILNLSIPIGTRLDSYAGSAKLSQSGHPAADHASHSMVMEALNGSTKWVVSAAAAGTWLLRRDAQSTWCVLGSVLATVLCKARRTSRDKHDTMMPRHHRGPNRALAAV